MRPCRLAAVGAVALAAVPLAVVTTTTATATATAAAVCNRYCDGRDPALAPSGGPTRRCSIGCHHCDRYVAGGGTLIPLPLDPGRHRPHNAAGHRTRITCGPGSISRICMTRKSTGPMPSWLLTMGA